MLWNCNSIHLYIEINQCWIFRYFTEEISSNFSLYFFIFQNYFRDGWNVFDSIIVLGSLLDFIFSKTMVSITSWHFQLYFTWNYFQNLLNFQTSDFLFYQRGILTEDNEEVNHVKKDLKDVKAYIFCPWRDQIEFFEKDVLSIQYRYFSYLFCLDQHSHPFWSKRVSLISSSPLSEASSERLYHQNFAMDIFAIF